MSNPLRPDLMTPAERLDEIAEILAAGLMRLRARQSSHLSSRRRRKFARLCRPPERSCQRPQERQEAWIDRHGSGAVWPHSKRCRCRSSSSNGASLFDTEPPPFNRRYLESRLAYRIQELAYGGLKPDTIKRLEALAEDLEVGSSIGSVVGSITRPVAGTQLVREWQGTEHRVTVVRRWLRIPRPAVQIPLRDRARDHRHSLERLGLFRHEKSAGSVMNKPIVASCAVQSTPANPPKRDWTKSSTRSTPSATPARPTLPVKRPRAGASCRSTTMTAAFQERRSNVPR